MVDRKMGYGVRCMGVAFNMTDQDLIAQYQGGDQQAFSRLYRKYWPSVYGYVRKLLWNKGDAKDITQDTFVKVILYGNSYRPVIPFFSWLMTIAKRLAYNENQKQIAGKRLGFEVSKDERDDEDCPPLYLQSESDPLEETIAKMDTDRLKERLTEIPEQYAKPLILRHFEGMNYAEVARIMNTPLGTVKSRIKRGRDLL